MSPSPPPASLRREPAGKDLPPESTTLLQTSPPSSSSESATSLGITPKTRPNMDTSADTPPALLEKTVDFYNLVPPSQDLATSSDEFDETDENGDCTRKGGPGVTNQAEDYGIPEGNLTGIEVLDKNPELTGDASLPILTSHAGGLFAMAPEFSLVGYEATKTNETHKRERNKHIKDDPSQQEILHPSIPIPQTAEVSAEATDMLDAIPPELVTPETLPILDGMSGVHAETPTVGFVEEESVISLSEAPGVAAEVADTAAMLDRFIPTTRQPITGLGAYAAEQTLEEAQIGTTRMVQITEPDDTLASIEEEIVVENGDSLMHESGKLIDIAEPTTNTAMAFNEEQPISAHEGGGHLLVEDTLRPATPPYLRAKVKPKFPYSTSDSELSSMSSMSNLSTGNLNNNITMKTFPGTIYIEDLVDLTSDLYATTWNVPTNTVKCVVDPNPRLGSKNIFYSAELYDKYKTRKHKLIIRIPLSSGGFNSTEKSWFQSDIRAMEFIKERTDIPIPFIYGYDANTQNKIGAPYVLMDFMEGNRVEDVWEAWDDEKKTRCLLQCSESMRQLGRFRFNMIGVLGCDYSKGGYTVHGIPFDTKDKGTSLNGPYISTKAYLEDIWRAEAMGLRSSTEPEAVRAMQSLILLKLLIPTLMEPESSTQRFFLSFPEFGGGNVLVDSDGNVEAFIGWEKVMILPKAIGYARYPKWITKDWISSQGNNLATMAASKHPSIPGTVKAEVSPGIGRDPLTETSLYSGNTERVVDNKGIIRGHIIEESGDVLEKAIPISKTLAPSPQSSYSEVSEQKSHHPLAIKVPESSVVGLSEAISQELTSVPVSIDPQPHDDPAPAGSSGGKEKQSGRGEGNKNNKRKGWRRGWRNNLGNDRGSRPQPHLRHNYDCDESTEFQRATTAGDKAKLQALSQWNSFPERVDKVEAEEREERRRAWMAKEETEKAIAISRACKLPPVVETFKKVIVEQSLERKPLKVVRTERKEHDSEVTDIKDVAVPQPLGYGNMIRYRKVYHQHFVNISPEDGLANKSSHISTAVYTAITNNKLRSSIVPKLAKYVIGEAVGPSILRMVGNSQWAKELLMKLDKENDGFKKDVKSIHEGEKINVEGMNRKGGGYGNAWETLILGPALAIGITVVGLGALILLAWVFGFAKYHLHPIWSENGYIASVNLNLNLQIPVLSQPSVAMAMKSLVADLEYLPGRFLGKVGAAVNFATDYNLAFAAALLMVFLVVQSRARTAVRYAPVLADIAKKNSQDIDVGEF